MATAVACALLSPAATAGGVLLFAAASTMEAVDDVLGLYAESGGGRVRAAYAASSALARQIANGAPADLFLSANDAWMDWLGARNLIVARSRRELFGNRLVLVVPRRNRAVVAIRPGFPLARLLGAGRLSLADPDHVPAGIYAKQALVNLGLWAAVGRRAARAQDVRGALELVARGEAPAGIVYATDARISPGVRVAGVFPRASHAPITYPLALVKGRDRRDARAFYRFLVSPRAMRAFARRGFIVE